MCQPAVAPLMTHELALPQPVDVGDRRRLYLHAREGTTARG
ncbi:MULTISPECIES: hypothetical protein [Streptomyces]|nr:hypothetical protein [Streptomyces sp. CL12-4]